MKCILAFALVALTCSCSERRQPINIIEKGKFEAVYVELLDSAAASKPSSNDSTISPTAERIFKRHGVTLKQFRATVRSYNLNAQEWKEFFENVVTKIHDRGQEKNPH